jgi:hypothetical protein
MKENFLDFIVYIFPEYRDNEVKAPNKDSVYNLVDVRIKNKRK